MPSFAGATAWLNSPPLTPDGLRGKVVVVDFCTYTCINWLRSLPYVRAWDERYRGPRARHDRRAHARVLVRARPRTTSARRSTQMRVDVSDRDRQRLRGLGGLREPLLAGAVLRRRGGSHPASPLRRGRLRALGERYPAARSPKPVRRSSAATWCPWTPSGPEAAADWDSLTRRRRTSGIARRRTSRRPAGRNADAPKVYEAPEHLRRNHWALSGDWTAMAEAAVLERAEGPGRLPIPCSRRAPRDGPGGAESRAVLACRSMARRRAPRTGATSTRMDPAR